MPIARSATMTNLAACVTVKTTPEEYCDFFWSHGANKELTYKGETFTLDASRSEFCDEDKTKIYQNTKDKMDLLVTVDGE